VRKIGVVLLALGGFLVMTGILTSWYAPSRIEKTPLNVDETIHLSGTGTINGKTFPIKIASVYFSDTSRSDSNVISFVNSTCVVKDVGNAPECVGNKDPKKRLITAGVDHYATDRVTALSVNDPQYLPPDAVPHDGLENKFPFHVKKISYPIWDNIAGKAYPATYDGTETLNGLETYKFAQTIDAAPIHLAPHVKGLYSNTLEYWVEPVTGSIVKVSQQPVQADEKGKPVVSLDFVYTPEQIATSVDKAKKDRDQLNLLEHTVPLVGFIVGIPVLLIGLGLVIRGPGGRTRTS
jgi:hypothetical protein